MYFNSELNTIKNGMADRMINGLESENSVNFYGEPMSDEDKASLKTALLVALEMNKKRSKQKD